MPKIKLLSVLFPMFLAALLSAVSVTAAGCSSGLKHTECIDCTQFPLNYQGAVLQYTDSTYIHTACFTIDLTNAEGFKDFKIGDYISIEYKVKRGGFCEPDDESTYTIRKVTSSASDFKEPESCTVPAAGFRIRKY